MFAIYSEISEVLTKHPQTGQYLIFDNKLKAWDFLINKMDQQSVKELDLNVIPIAWVKK